MYSDKKILFTDMDGTLLNNDSVISDNMMACLNRLTDAGHYLVLSSGRPMNSIIERVVKLKLNIPNLIIISNNGGLIRNYVTGEDIYKIKIPADVVSALEEIADSHNLHIQGYTDEDIVVHKEDDELRFYKGRIHIPFVETDRIGEYLKKSNGSLKMLAIHLSNHDLLEAFKKEAEDKLGDKIDAVFSNDKYLEIIPKGVSKGNAIKKVTEYLNVDPDNTFAAGDEENDISMIVAAHTGIAMKNARDSVKAAADIVTEKDNHEDGLADIIEKLILNS